MLDSKHCPHDGRIKKSKLSSLWTSCESELPMRTGNQLFAVVADFSDFSIRTWVYSFKSTFRHYLTLNFLRMLGRKISSTKSNCFHSSVRRTSLVHRYFYLRNGITFKQHQPTNYSNIVKWCPGVEHRVTGNCFQTYACTVSIHSKEGTATFESIHATKNGQSAVAEMCMIIRWEAMMLRIR